MKHTLRRVAAFLFLLTFTLALALPGAAEQASRSSVPQTYRLMVDAFERGGYADAYDMAKEIFQENPSYENIFSYYHYLLALVEYLPAGKYMEAYNEFDVLSISGFAKSAGYAAFTRGRRYEEDGQYEQAIAAYQTAIQNGVNEAQERIFACRAAVQTSAYEAAQFQEQQGNYRVAGDGFAALIGYFADAQQKANQNYYKAAEQLSKAGQYGEAADLFTMLGEYSDSRDKAIQNRQWALGGNNPATLELRLESATATTLSIAWKNELNHTSFTVAYAPVGMDSLTQTVTVAGTSYELTGLIPNTEYSVKVSAGGGTSQERGAFYTMQAPAVSDARFGYPRAQLCVCDASAAGLGLLNVVTSMADGLYTDLTETGMSPLTRKPSQTNDRYFVNAFFRRRAEEPENLTLRYVLRLNGKYSCDKTVEVSDVSVSVPNIPLDVTDLMDALYDNHPDEGEMITVDAYVDGQYLCTATVKISR